MLIRLDATTQLCVCVLGGSAFGDPEASGVDVSMLLRPSLPYPLLPLPILLDLLADARWPRVLPPARWLIGVICSSKVGYKGLSQLISAGMQFLAASQILENTTVSLPLTLLTCHRTHECAYWKLSRLPIRHALLYAVVRGHQRRVMDKSNLGQTNPTLPAFSQSKFMISATLRRSAVLVFLAHCTFKTVNIEPALRDALV